MTLSITSALLELSDTARRTAEQLEAQIGEAAAMVRATLEAGGTLLFCGNGGSAADAQHMATEYVVRYMKNRRAYAAIALTTDTSLLTAAGNDLGFDHIFSRQVEALGKPQDLLIIHSTSGNSANVLEAAKAASRIGMKVLSLTAKDGGQLKRLSDLTLIVPTERTDRAQEVHLCIQHLICESIEGNI